MGATATVITPIQISSNSKEFLRTRKIPRTDYGQIIEVTWVEEWVKGGGSKTEVTFTRLFDGYKTVKWDRATSFAFKLAVGNCSSLDRRKAWEMTKDNALDGEAFLKVISVELSVRFT